MATKVIAWTTGTGNITLTYIGQGDGTIEVRSDANNLYSDRQQSIVVRTTQGTPVVSRTVTVVQKGYTVPIGTVYNFSYTGDVQEVTLSAGTYKLQVWGAQGGSSTGTYAATGSKGGYSEGILTLASTTTLYVFVGGAGEIINSSSTSTTVVNGGWNGGGGAKPYNYVGTGPSRAYSYPRAGGGATDIALVTSSMTYSNNRTNRSPDSLLSRIIVAGGGGGSSYIRKGGGSSYSYTSTEVSVGGGTSGGGQYGGSQSSAGTGGGFGYGGNQSTSYPIMPGAGGGGWYGGGFSNPSQATAQTVNYNGGGSGFVNIAENAQYRPTGYTGLELDFGATYAGDTSFPSTSTGNETGHSGNGYARITCIDKKLLIPLTFDILGNGAIVWKHYGNNGTKTIQYKKNDGDWTSITSTATGVEIPVSSGDILQFIGYNDAYGTGESNYANFTATCDFNARGNIMSLLSFNDSFSQSNAFVRLFATNTHLIDASNLLLPVTTLTASCYRLMFSGCSGMQAAPKLPATTLASNCYYYMFNGCTGLTTAPELLATTLASSCYEGMFAGCTGLTKAPDLLATRTATQCYNYMFWKCSNLNYIKCLTVQTSGTLSFTGFTDGVAATGTFVKPSEATWATGTNGIPSGWTVENAS